VARSLFRRPSLALAAVRRWRVVLGLVAVALGLVAVAVTAAEGDLDGGSSGSGAPGATTGIPSPAQGSTGAGGGGAGGPGQPQGLRQPPVVASQRTYPQLSAHAGGRNTTFNLQFRLRRTLGHRGNRQSFYGVIVSPVDQTSRPGCYGFGRYVTRGRRGQVAVVALHPHHRLWCAGNYEASVYLTGRPYCSPHQLRHHPCSTASYVPVPTGRAYFKVR
jgi:hypothetical protein